jgi:hypothetical protein
LLERNDRALKEWAAACEALRTGQQTALIRKGGIREVDGIFRVEDPEFFLMPTYEHQDFELLQDEYRLLAASNAPPPSSVSIDTYCVVDSVIEVKREERLPAIRCEHIWNERYVRMRLEFNPYDPLFVILLRAYRIPAAQIPMEPEYEGCRSWVTLKRGISTLGAAAALSDEEFQRRRALVLEADL